MKPVAPTFVDCFSGAGGLSLGFVLGGFRPVYAFDSDAVACETYARNLGHDIRHSLLADLDATELLSELGMNPDVVVGGPPCQGFSTQRQGNNRDRRNDLVDDYLKFALELGPRVILMENVPGVLGRRGRRPLERGLARLGSAGYEFTAGVIDAASVGVPQRRKRAVLVAWDPHWAKPFDLESIARQSEVRTVRDAIGDMPSPPHDCSVHPDFPNHARARMSARNLERIEHVPPGGGRLDVPYELQLHCHRDTSHRHLDVYGRLEWDKPAGTITAMFDNFTRGRFAHPAEHRNITNREGARLQTFPDNFVFLGPKKDVARQIGNAVPPLLSQALAAVVLEMLSD